MYGKPKPIEKGEEPSAQATALASMYWFPAASLQERVVEVFETTDDAQKAYYKWFAQDIKNEKNIFQEQLKLGFMGLFIYLGYQGMLWLHELKATRVKSFKFHLAYKLGFNNFSKFPKSYMTEFVGN